MEPAVRRSAKRSNGGATIFVVLATAAATILFDVTSCTPCLASAFCPIHMEFSSTRTLRTTGTDPAVVPSSLWMMTDAPNVPLSNPSRRAATKSSLMMGLSPPPNSDGSLHGVNPPNEFSRTVQADRLLKAGGGKVRRTAAIMAPTREGSYGVTVAANADECQALAHRFELTRLSRLEATLQIRPSSSVSVGSGGGGAASSIPPVEVEGTIVAQLTQTCVRTNEAFEVDVEFPIYALVRPISMAMMASDGSNWMVDDVIVESSPGRGENDDDGGGGGRGTNNKTRSNNKKKNLKHQKRHEKQQFSQQSRQVYNLRDVMDLQAAIKASEEYRMGTDDDADDDGDETEYDHMNNRKGYEAAASLVEDESIYSLSTGKLDVGELVAQTFWLQLDPYPKKPGTGPIEISITG